MIIINEAKCTACGYCSKVCICDVFIPQPGKAPDCSNQTSCMHCGQCFAVCPMGAISMDGVMADDLGVLEHTSLNKGQSDLLFKGCRSVRNYKPELVDRAVLLDALEDARYAPTASNTQNVEWILVEDPAHKQAILDEVVAWAKTLNLPQHAKRIAAHMAGGDMILRGAPQAIFVHTPDIGGPGKANAAIALSYLALALHNRGIGSCWAGFVMMAVEAGKVPSLPVPEGRKLGGGLMFGYPSIRYMRAPVRKPVQLQVL